MKKKKNFFPTVKKLGIAAGALLVIAWLCGFAAFANRINNYPLDDTTHTGAVIALTGGRYRIAEAVNILNQGKADKLFISGVSRKSSLDDIKKRQKLNINDESGVSLGHQARDTIGNARETVAWLQKNNISSIRLVTSNYHVERSIAEFKARDPNLKIIPHPVYSDKVEKKWWKSWHTFSLIFSEYNKFLFVYIRCNFIPKGR